MAVTTGVLAQFNTKDSLKIQNLLNKGLENLESVSRIDNFSVIYVDNFCGKGFSRVKEVALASKKNQVDIFYNDEKITEKGNFFLSNVLVKTEVSAEKKLNYVVRIYQYGFITDQNYKYFIWSDRNDKLLNPFLEIRNNGTLLYLSYFRDETDNGEKVTEFNGSKTKKIWNMALEKAVPELEKCNCK